MAKARRPRKASPKEAAAYAHSRRAEVAYARKLRAVAVQIINIMGGFPPDHTSDIEDALRKYADLLMPWARAVAMRMLTDVARRDQRAWEMRASDIGRALKKEIAEAPTGVAMRELMQEQVALITSLPLEAAQKVHAMVLGEMPQGTRPGDLEAGIKALGDITKGRAKLIARTEVARATTALTQVRALSVGSVEYIWRSAHDARVRPDHEKLNGRVFRWDSPPIADSHSGVRAHAGAIYNCRCYPEPIIPDD